MTPFQAAVVVAVMVFAVGLVLLIGVVALKLSRRRRATAHNIRHGEYLRAISQHIVAPGSIPPFTAHEAGDDAFIDAVIALRSTLEGDGIEQLSGVIDRTGLIEQQAAKLRSLFPLGRRLRAVVALAEIGDVRAARLLLHHLNDRVPEIRVQSARGLARMRYTSAIDVILDRFEGESRWVQTRFAESLALFGRDAVWPLVAFIRVHHQHDNKKGITEIIRVLGIVGDSEAGPALAELLYTAEDVEIRLAIIDSLGLIGGPLALRPLRRMIQSEDWRIRAKTVRAFGLIGDPSINPILREHLLDPSWWVRRNSAAALRDLPGGVELLYEALDFTDAYARDAAAEALADAGELVAAQDRLEAGLGTERDFQLVGYMQASVGVQS